MRAKTFVEPTLAPTPEITDDYGQANPARTWFARLMSCVASWVVIALPDCACTSWMKALSIPHALEESADCAAASAAWAFSSFALRLLAIPRRRSSSATLSISCCSRSVGEYSENVAALILRDLK